MTNSSSLRSPSHPVTTLFVSPVSSDRCTLTHIFTRSNWRLRSASSCQEALALLRKETIPVVICDRELPDGNWRRLLEGTEDLPHRPRVIVSAREVNEYLWADVLQAGGYDLLSMPWESRELLKVIALAWRSWEFANRVVSRPPQSVSREHLTLAVAGA